MYVNEIGLKSEFARRSRLEIHLDILKSVKAGKSKPTRIMYAANLSWKPLNQNLSSLVSNGFLRIQFIGEEDARSNRIYEITKKGENVLRYMSSEKDVLDLIEIAHISNVEN